MPLFGVHLVDHQSGGALHAVRRVATRRGRARAWCAARTTRVEQKVELLDARLRALLAGERRRLGEVRVLLTDVESGASRSIESIEGDKLRRFRESLWFD